MKLIPRKGSGNEVDFFQDFVDVQKELNRLFDVSLHRPTKVGNGGAIWLPPVDILDEKDHLRVRVEIPGIKKEDIDVAVDQDTLVIKGERKQEKEIKEKAFYQAERYYGAFHRAFTLPTSVDPHKVNAVYKEGVLEITLLKKENVKSKQIKIDVK